VLPTNTLNTPTIPTAVSAIIGKYLIGDADGDGKATVKDATKVQKHVAKNFNALQVQL